MTWLAGIAGLCFVVSASYAAIWGEEKDWSPAAAFLLGLGGVILICVAVGAWCKGCPQ